MSDKSFQFEGGKSFQFEEGKSVAFECPFCGAKVVAGENSTGVPAIVHGVPGCVTFMKHDVTEYMRRVNKAVRLKKRS